MGGDELGRPVQKLVELPVLARLHQPQMPLGQGERRLARHQAQYRQLGQRRRHRRRQHGSVALAADAVEDDASDAHLRPVAGEAVHEGRRARPLAADVDHQHHRPAGDRRQVGGGAGLGPPVGECAVEQAHDALAEHQLGALGRFGHQRRQGLVSHGPGVEIDAAAATGGGVEGRVDVVRPRLGGGDGDTGAREVA